LRTFPITLLIAFALAGPVLAQDSDPAMACTAGVQQVNLWCGESPPTLAGAASIAANCDRAESEAREFCPAAGARMACQGALQRQRVWCANRPLLGNPMVPNNPATRSANCSISSQDVQRYCQ